MERIIVLAKGHKISEREIKTFRVVQATFVNEHKSRQIDLNIAQRRRFSRTGEPHHEAIMKM